METINRVAQNRFPTTGVLTLVPYDLRRIAEDRRLATEKRSLGIIVAPAKLNRIQLEEALV